MLGNMLRNCSQNGPIMLSNSVLKRTKMDFTGKTVIIAGGITYLGNEMSKIFLSKNVANLGLLALREDSGLKQLKNINPMANIIYCKTDTANKEEMIENMGNIVDKFNGCLDIFISNSTHLWEKNIDGNVEMNLLGPIYGTLCALCYMDKSKGGRGGIIANVSSVFSLEPCGVIASFSAAQHGIVGWTRSMAAEAYYEKTCVKHMVVCPGITRLMLTELKDTPTTPGLKNKVEKMMATNITPGRKVAHNIVEAIERDKNGSIWIVDGKLKEVKPTKYWSPPI